MVARVFHLTLKVILILALGLPAWAFDGFPASDLQGSKSMGKFLGLYEDTSENLPFDSILSGQREFVQSQNEVPSLGFTSSTYWAKVSLIFPKESAGALLFSLNFPLMDAIEYYAPDSLGKYQVLATGYAQKFSSRKIKHSHFLFNVVPRPGQTVTYYFRFRNTDRMEIPLFLWQRQEFLEQDQESQFQTGIFLGLIASAILLNLLMFLTFRDRSYLHYTSFLFFFAIFVATQIGIANEYLWPEFLTAYNHYIGFVILGVLLSLVTLSQSYLSTEVNFPKYHRLFQRLKLLLLFCLGLCVILPTRLGILLTVVTCAFTFITVFVITFLTSNRSRIARYFLLAWTLALVTGAIYALISLGVIALGWFRVEVLAVVWVLQFVILSMGLAERLLAARHEKELLQRTAIENLEKSNELKDEFLSNTSHELRTPLNGIVGIAESLIDGAAGPLAGDVCDNLQMVISSGKRLTNLVNDVLDFSHLKSGQLVLKKNAVNLQQVTSMVLAVLAPLANRKQPPIELRNQVPDNLPFVKADEDRLQQILHNLIGNAIKFTESGFVSVDAVREGEYIRVCIQDSGIGISPEKHEEIFESFRQGDASISRNYGGAGLGLSLSRQLVDLHGGRIWLESTLGNGSQFFFTLPLAEEGTQPAEHSVTRPSFVSTILESNEVPQDSLRASVGAGDFRILAVDDEPMNLKILKNQLTSNGYHVITANNGPEALEILASNAPPDLVLLDVMMPRMSGYEVCRKIRSDYYDVSTLPVIMLTAKNQASDLVEGLESGANDYLTKPFIKAELLARIRAHIQLAKVNQSYARFVPIQLLKQLGHEDIVSLQLGDHVERRMAVFFSDIRNFAALSESMSAEENFNFLNSYLGRVGPIISESNGFIDKYMGDGMMALFPESAQDAVVAAVSIVREMNIYNSHRQRCGYRPIQVGIGIHVGKLMLGTIGEVNRMDGTVISDAVNLAARLEQMNKVLGASIVVSREVMDELSPELHEQSRFLGRIKVRGKQVPVDVFDVFAGDSLELNALRKKTQVEFEAGVDAFFVENFAKASQCFTGVLAQDTSDLAAQAYLARCKQQKDAISKIS